MQNCFYINIYIYISSASYGSYRFSGHQFPTSSFVHKIGNTDVVRGYVTEYSFPAVFMTTGISMKRGDPNENSRYVSWR